MSDYISKKKLISHIEAEYKSFGEDYDALQILGDIEDFPTEERPHGEWIDEGVYADYVGQHVYKCTFCNDHIIEYPSELGSYCKYCGSDNRKKEKRNEWKEGNDINRVHGQTI